MTDISWMKGAPCKGVSSDVYFPDLYDEDALAPIPSLVKETCARCPLQDRCLKFALDTDAYGFWASTSRFQRLNMGKTKRRVHCPACTSEMVLAQGRTETCMSCGVSWPI